MHPLQPIYRIGVSVHHTIKAHMKPTQGQLFKYKKARRIEISNTRYNFSPGGHQDKKDITEENDEFSGHFQGSTPF